MVNDGGTEGIRRSDMSRSIADMPIIFCTDSPFPQAKSLEIPESHPDNRRATKLLRWLKEISLSLRPPQLEFNTSCSSRDKPDSAPAEENQLTMLGLLEASMRGLVDGNMVRPTLDLRP